MFPIHLYFEFNILKNWYKNRGFEFDNSFDYISSKDLSFSCTKYFLADTCKYYLSKNGELIEIFDNLDDKDKNNFIKSMDEKRRIEVHIYIKRYFFKSNRSADYELFFRISINDPQASMLEKLYNDYGVNEWRKLINNSFKNEYIFENFRYENGEYFSNTHSITNNENKYIWNANQINSEYHKFGKITLLNLEENLNSVMDNFIMNFSYYQRDDASISTLINGDGASGIKKLMQKLSRDSRP